MVCKKFRENVDYRFIQTVLFLFSLATKLKKESVIHSFLQLNHHLFIGASISELVLVVGSCETVLETWSNITFDQG